MTVGLALVVWLIYLVDRLLDGLGGDQDRLDVRHGFYRANRRLVGGALVPAASLAVCWLAVGAIPEGLMWQCVALGLMVGVYLDACVLRGRWRMGGLAGSLAGLGTLIVLAGLPVSKNLKLVLSLAVLLIMAARLPGGHRADHRSIVPKELFASLLFALGCSAAVHFFVADDGVLILGVETMLMWGLFFLNMTGIACVEDGRAGDDDPAAAVKRWPGIRSAYAGLLGALFLGALAAAILAAANLLPASTRLLATAVAAGAVLLGLLWRWRERVSPQAYRVLADTATAVPACLAWLVTR